MTDRAQPASGTDEMEADVTAVIEASGGDARTAIKALLVENLIQEQRIERLASALSFGYVRGRIGVTSGQAGSSNRETSRRPFAPCWYRHLRHQLERIGNFEG